jgi:hypothetical protein
MPPILRRLSRRDRFFLLAWIAACGLASGFAGFLAAMRLGVIRGDLASGIPESTLLVQTQQADSPTPSGNSPALARLVAARSDLFEAVGFYWVRSDTLVQVEGRYEVFKKTNATSGFFDALNVRPFLGSFVEGYVISHEIWQSRFAGRPDILGTPVTPEGAGPEFSSTIVAVLPPGMTFPERTQIWLIEPTVSMLRGGPRHRLGILVSLTDGQQLRDGQAHLGALASQAYPPDTRQRVVLQSLKDYVMGPSRPALFAISMTTVLFVVVAIISTSNLVLARVIRLIPDYRVMSALGAPFRGVALGAIGELTIVAFLAVALGWTTWFSLDRLTSLWFPDVHIIGSWHSPLAIIAVTALVWLVCGVVTVAALLRWLGSGDSIQFHRSYGSTQTWAVGRRALAMSQVSLAVGLALVAGVTATTHVWRMHQVRSLEPDQVILVSTRHPVLLVEERGATTYPYGRFLETAEAVSTVVARSVATTAVAHVAPAPVADSPFNTTFRTPFAPEQPEHPVTLYSVSESFFDVMRMHVILGRGFRSSDRLSAAEVDGAFGSRPGVAILSKSAASTLGGPRQALGQKLSLAGPLRTPLEVVGVVDDFRGRGLDRPPEPAIYVPYAEFPMNNPTFIVRTDAPQAASEAASLAVRRSRLPIALSEITNLGSAFRRALSVRTVSTILVGYSAICCIALACASMFGLLAFLAQARRRETAIFLALGWPRRAVRQRLARGLSFQLILSGAVGIAIGLGVVRMLPDMVVLAPGSVLAIGVSCAISVVILAIISVHATAAAFVDRTSLTALLTEP